MNVTEKFKVVAVTENTNGFGLKQCVLIAKSGTAFKACANTLNMPKKGDVLDIPAFITERSINYHFSERGFEIPEQMEDAPEEVVDEVWKQN